VILVAVKDAPEVPDTLDAEDLVAIAARAY